jgi:hypothetical protein
MIGSVTSNMVTTGSASASFSVTGIPAGTYTITATYNPGPDFNASTGTNMLTVSQATTNTTVTSSLGTSTYMEGVTFTVTVAPQYSGTPTGSVSFYDAVSGENCANAASSHASTEIGTAQTLTNGLTSITTASLPGGSDPILACYTGDGNFFSSSGTFVQTVMPAPVLTVSQSSIAFGNQNVNTTSNPYTIMLTNNGDAPLNFEGSGITVIGTYGSEFPIKTDTCGATIAAGSSCTIMIDFAPVDSGAANATLHRQLQFRRRL